MLKGLLLNKQLDQNFEQIKRVTVDFRSGKTCEETNQPIPASES